MHVMIYEYQVLGMLKSEEMLVRVWILKMASARMGARESLLILLSVS